MSCPALPSCGSPGARGRWLGFIGPRPTLWDSCESRYVAALGCCDALWAPLGGFCWSQLLLVCDARTDVTPSCPKWQWVAEAAGHKAAAPANLCMLYVHRDRGGEDPLSVHSSAALSISPHVAEGLLCWGPRAHRVQGILLAMQAFAGCTCWVRGQPPGTHGCVQRGGLSGGLCCCIECWWVAISPGLTCTACEGWRDAL